MSYNLFLDDVRIPKNVFKYTNNPIYISVDWVIVRTYDEFIKYVEENGIPEIISFDHDLSDEHLSYQEQFSNRDIYDVVEEKTGFHCAKWFIDYCIDNEKELPTDILIHSMNPVGSLNIKSLFDTYNKYHKKGLI